MAKIKIGKKEKEFLLKVGREGFSNRAYNEALRTFEKYYKKYEFDEDTLYLFGMLYDHLGQRFRTLSQKAKSVVNKRKYLKRSNKYFEKAVEIFNLMLKKNPKSFDALYGIGKVYRNKGNYKKALLYSKKAYRMSKGGAVYGIGLIYENMGDTKKALYWYKKELKDKGEKDYGAALNFLIFSNRQYRRKMRKYAEAVKKHYTKEPAYFKKTKFGKFVKREIDIILSEPRT